jgi:hypothetical protein
MESEKFQSRDKKIRCKMRDYFALLPIVHNLPLLRDAMGRDLRRVTMGWPNG